MGTMMSAAAWGPDGARLERALDAAQDSVQRLDSLLSTFRDDSEISEINRRAGTASARAVTSSFAAVLAEALAVAEASGGAFDPTKRNWRGVRFDSARGTVRLAPGLALDFGGIAKGYALDRAALAFAGVADSVLLDLGGQYLWVAVAHPATRRPVGIVDPENSARVLAIVELVSGSISTSSQAEQPGHIVDPRTRPVRAVERTSSVTVLAPDGMTADAWSTAFFVLGCDSALALAGRLERWRVGVLCADSSGVRWTPDLEGRVLVPSGAAEVGRSPETQNRAAPRPARVP